MTDTDTEMRGFPGIKPVDATPEMDRFIDRHAPTAGHRRVHQPRRSSCGPTRPSSSKTSVRGWKSTRRPRALRRPGVPRTFPEWPPSDAAVAVADSGPDDVTMDGHFSRFHVGGNGAVHGGVIPLFYDWHFGMVVSAAGRPDSRTAYLHVDYRKITPIDEPLVARAWIDSVDGRKAFVTATMTDSDGNVLSEANGLMIKLLPHQP